MTNQIFFKTSTRGRPSIQEKSKNFVFQILVDSKRTNFWQIHSVLCFVSTNNLYYFAAMHFVIQGTPKYIKKCIFVSSPSTVFLSGLCSFRANSQTIVALFYYYFTYGPRAQTVCIVPSAGALSNYIEKASTDISDFLRSFSFLTVCSCFAVFVF